MTEQLLCWKCGADISGLPQPMGRRAECLSCHAELHVCLMCRHHDPGKARQCREPMVEDVKDKTRANFCDWFQVKTNAYVQAAHGTNANRSALAELFGETDAKKVATPPGLDSLFGD